MMPGYKGHSAGGLLTFFVLFVALRPHIDAKTAVVLCACTIAGALFPDIDTKSKGQKWFYRVVFFCLIVLLLLQQFFFFAVLSLLVGLPLVVDHRGLFHRLWFIVTVVGVTIGVLDWYQVFLLRETILPALFFVAGAVSHLVLDVGLLRFLQVRK
jgi:hypothetical protein